MSTIASYILHHHERVDGKGYPKGLVGDEIPIQSKILAVADAYAAMTSERPYREAYSKEKAIEELVRGAGNQFDKKIVEIFISKVLSNDN
jgi:HD-GYP domain-containing protein (c-di-GMP phosphodiesterase class II)